MSYTGLLRLDLRFFETRYLRLVSDCKLSVCLFNDKTIFKLDSYCLSENPVKSATVFLDACFSGAGRSGDVMLASRSVAIKPNVAAPKGNMVVFSASSNDETAYPYHEKGHGLFTYFLCKKLQETEGKVTLGELEDGSVLKNGDKSLKCRILSLLLHAFRPKACFFVVSR